MITFHSQLTATKGKSCILNCPACNSQNVPSRPFESVDQVKIAYLIPLLKLRTTHVDCGKCHALINCTAPLEEVSRQDAQTITPWLRYHPTAGAKAVSLAALFLSWDPVVGLVMASVAAFVARGTRGWATGINVLSLIIAATVTGSVGALFFIH